ncbi:MAG: DUF177 domain-containing protein [Methylobacteriaceae bacterium]|nr:DUF177 domain-containing protein [Methylobacteriaceae bacterium]
MITDSVGPFSRPVAVNRLPDDGTEVTVTANEEERRDLAMDFGLPAIGRLEGRFRLRPTRTGVQVAGTVTAEVTQTCVVTLEPFDSILTEEVEVEFTEPSRTSPRGEPAPELEADLDIPDEIVDGRVDLGAVTSEFLALGLDPYPRKPGVSFAFEDDPEAKAGPLAELARLRRGEG